MIVRFSNYHRFYFAGVFEIPGWISVGWKWLLFAICTICWKKSEQMRGLARFNIWQSRDWHPPGRRRSLRPTLLIFYCYGTLQWVESRCRIGRFTHIRQSGDCHPPGIVAPLRGAWCWGNSIATKLLPIRGNDNLIDNINDYSTINCGLVADFCGIYFGNDVFSKASVRKFFVSWIPGLRTGNSLQCEMTIAFGLFHYFLIAVVCGTPTGCVVWGEFDCYKAVTPMG